MLAARYSLKAMDPVWFRGLGLGGNAWDPAILHATALNHALISALGFQQPHQKLLSIEKLCGTLWAPHSLPYPALGFWMSPAELVQGSAAPVQVFRGGRSGEKLHLTAAADKANAKAEKAKHGTSTYQTRVTADGFILVKGSPGNTGKPYLTTGYLGAWEGVLLAEDREALKAFPAQGLSEDTFILRLGPNRVAVALTLQPFEEVMPVEGEGCYAQHLLDPMLLPSDLEGEAVFAKPAPLCRVEANGCIEGLMVRTFPIRRSA